MKITTGEIKRRVDEEVRRTRKAVHDADPEIVGKEKSKEAIGEYSIALEVERICRVALPAALERLIELVTEESQNEY